MANVVQIAVNAVNNTAQGLQDAQNNVSSFGNRTKALLAGVGMAGAGLFAEGLSSAMDLSAAQTNLQNQLGLTGKEADKAGKVAGSVFSDGFGGSLDEVTEALGGVHSSIGKLGSFTQGQLAQMSKDALGLAKTFGVDVNEATSAVGQMMKTGLVKDANEGFDLITKTMQSVPAHLRDDILPTLQEYGTQFRKVGLDGKTAMGLISQGLQHGARDADIVADSIKEFSIRAVDGSKTTSNGFKQLGLDGQKMAEMIGKGGKTASKGLDMTLDSLRKVKDPVKRAQIAVELFGTQAEDMGAALYALDPSGAAAATGMDKAGGAAKKLTDKMEASPAQQMDKAMRTLKTTLGEALLPIVKKASDFFAKHSGIIKQLAPYILAVVGAITAWVAIQTALNFVMAANPVGAIILAIVALAGALVYAYKKSETFRNMVNLTFSAVQVIVSNVVSVLLKLFAALVYAWMEVAGAILHGAAKAFGWVPGIGGKLKKADAAFGSLKDGVNHKFDQMIHKVDDWKKHADEGLKERALKMNISSWQRKLDQAKAKLKSVPESKRAKVRAEISDLQRKVDAAKAKLSQLHNKTVTVTINGVKTGVDPNQYYSQGPHKAYGGPIGAAAAGGARGSLTLVGEQGPELVRLPYGSTVSTNADSRRMMAGGGGGLVVLEVTGGESEFERFMVNFIRKHVRIKGGGDVQRAFGRA